MTEANPIRIFTRTKQSLTTGYRYSAENLLRDQKDYLNSKFGEILRHTFGADAVMQNFIIFSSARSVLPDYNLKTTIRAYFQTVPRLIGCQLHTETFHARFLVSLYPTQNIRPQAAQDRRDENNGHYPTWSQRLSFILSWQILRREPLLLFLFFWLGSSISASRRKFPNKKDNIKRKPLGPW